MPGNRHAVDTAISLSKIQVKVYVEMLRANKSSIPTYCEMLRGFEANLFKKDDSNA
jgi:hypothetical protein